MMVMVANQTNFVFGYLAGRYPGALGHLYSPGAQRGPHHFMPYALDNGAWSAHLAKQPWQPEKWRRLLLWSVMWGQPPLWAVVPDVVADREATLRAWETYAPEVRAKGIRPAFAVQDGMTFADVPSDDCILFIGPQGVGHPVSHPVHCPRCARETQAEKRHGFAPGRKSGRCGWWTVCLTCGKGTPGLPPGSAERLAAHHQEKVSAQVPLFGTAPRARVGRPRGRKASVGVAGQQGGAAALDPVQSVKSRGSASTPTRAAGRSRTISIVDENGRPLL